MKAIILGNGPTASHFSKKEGEWAIGCNDAPLHHPSLDATAVTDALRHIKRNRPAVLDLRGWHGEKYGGKSAQDTMQAIGGTFLKSRVHFRGRWEHGIPPRGEREAWFTYGLQTPIFALMIALWKGAKEVDVYGVDLADFDHEVAVRCAAEWRDAIAYCKRIGVSVRFHHASPAAALIGAETFGGHERAAAEEEAPAPAKKKRRKDLEDGEG